MIVTGETEAAQPNMMEELFTELRLALSAQHEAGYQRAKYVWSTRGQDDTAEASEAMLQATAKADDMTVALWRKLYDLAPALADALQVLEAVRHEDELELARAATLATFATEA